uniref:UDP-N-acetylglucosamine--N-acetylmuramyl-(pentapeptide) pyrophosphoryl-undecaprenol N-acetylglucosamine transferase n=1 Tax=Schlesneria paludicola TaxID=360056 RepID=A0A7C4QM78_9PLAN
MKEVYLFAGGGTGGHLFPGLAVAEALRQRHPLAQTVFVGTDRDIERRILAENNCPHVALPVSPLRQLWRRPDRFLWRNCRAIAQAKRLIAQYRPRAVIGLGELSSLPLVWTAHRAQIPIVLLEQNALPGRTTRWLAPCARVICVAFPECVDHLPKGIPALMCGNPVRRAIAELLREPPEPSSVHPPTLLVLGGSQGAEPLNAALIELVRRHHPQLSGWMIAHQTGAKQRSLVESAYAALGQPHVVADFFPDIAAMYRQASLVISRAGGTTLAELACAGKPMLLVPYPHATQQHQQANAEVFAGQGAAAVVQQADTAEVTAERLWSVLETWLSNAALRRRLGQAARTFAHPHAADRVVSLLDDAVRSAA